jgi:predicted acetyltransferase
MNSDELMLIEPTEVLRQAYIDFVDEFHAVGDPYIAKEWEDVHNDFSDFIRRLRDHANGVGLPVGWVPASTYWLVCAGRVVGACGLRHRLTESLRDFGGHVCYGVRPSERRKGHGTFMLRAMLDKAKEMGIGRVLVTCDARNIASTGVIAKCGGVMESESHSQGAGRITRRYWIDLQDVRPGEPCQ